MTRFILGLLIGSTLTAGIGLAQFSNTEGTPDYRLERRQQQFQRDLLRTQQEQNWLLQQQFDDPC